MSAPRFASFDVSNQIFWRSKLSLGVVNLKPIVPGHVLVIPKRAVQRLRDLQPDEIADLFLSVQTVGNVIERKHHATSLTVACQDGPAAGQSVPHVHVHILPRKYADFEPMDKVYDHLDAYAFSDGRSKKPPDPLKLDDEERRARSADEMAQEASQLSSFFEQSDA